jgi:hypothetical protein
MRLKARNVALGVAVTGTTVLTTAMFSGSGSNCPGTCGTCGFSCILPLAGLVVAGGISFLPARKKRSSEKDKAVETETGRDSQS